MTWETGPDWVLEDWVLEVGEAGCPADACCAPTSPVRPVAVLAGEPLLAALCPPPMR